MSPNAPIVDVAMGMRILLDRGRAALEARGLTLVGTSLDSMNVVTADDFATHAALILRHVVENGASTHILCCDGSLCALVQRLTERF